MVRKLARIKQKHSRNFLCHHLLVKLCSSVWQKAGNISINLYSLHIVKLYRKTIIIIKMFYMQLEYVWWWWAAFLKSVEFFFFFVTERFLTLKVLSCNDQMLFILTRQCFRSSSGSCFGLARVQIWFLWRLFGLALNSNQIFICWVYFL